MKVWLSKIPIYIYIYILERRLVYLQIFQVIKNCNNINRQSKYKLKANLGAKIVLQIFQFFQPECFTTPSRACPSFRTSSILRSTFRSSINRRIAKRRKDPARIDSEIRSSSYPSTDTKERKICRWR